MINKMIDLKNWENKNILVTGHTGFKGSWMSCILKKFNSKIYGLSDNKICSDNYKTLKREDIFEEEYEFDICNELDDIKQLNSIEFDYIFHFAAQGLVSQASKYPKNTILSNILGTYNILEFANKQKSLKGITLATTDKVYLHTDSNNTEDSQLGGLEFYSASKASAEFIISAFNNTRKNENFYTTVIRSGNVLGGGDGAIDRIVTDIVNSLKHDKKIILRNPESIRPWQHVLDSLWGYLLATEYSVNNFKNSIFNLNSESNNKFTVEYLAKKIIEEWGESLDNLLFEKQNSFYETNVLRINSQKAINLLSWKTLYEIDEIAKLIVNWEKASLNNENITLKQIDDYFNLIF